jgi:hypothetical protein
MAAAVRPVMNARRVVTAAKVLKVLNVLKVLEHLLPAAPSLHYGNT